MSYNQSIYKKHTCGNKNNGSNNYIESLNLIYDANSKMIPGEAFFFIFFYKKSINIFSEYKHCLISFKSGHSINRLGPQK